MQIPNTITPDAIKILSALGTEEEMEAFINHFVAASDFHDAQSEKLLRLGGREERPAGVF